MHVQQLSTVADMCVHIVNAYFGYVHVFLWCACLHPVIEVAQNPEQKSWHTARIPVLVGKKLESKRPVWNDKNQNFAQEFCFRGLAYQNPILGVAYVLCNVLFCVIFCVVLCNVLCCVMCCLMCCFV